MYACSTGVQRVLCRMARVQQGYTRPGRFCDSSISTNNQAHLQMNTHGENNAMNEK